MCSNTILVFPLNPFLQFPYEPHQLGHLSIPNRSEMWRNIARKASYSSRNLSSSSLLPISSFLSFSQDSLSCEKNRILNLRTPLNHRFYEMGFHQNGEFSPIISHFKSSIGKISGLPTNSRGFASVAEAVSSTDVDEDISSVEEIQGMLEELSKAQVSSGGNSNRIGSSEGIQQKAPFGMGSGKYSMLRRRQIKIETEAWDQADKEYKELLMDMCERKLAPNLPYVKSLFLGWFEPLRDQIAAEQELCRDPKNRMSHGPYFDRLPADMMAVITMHKLMSLLMTGGGDGTARVVQAACQIGEAIEQEVRIHRFLEKTRKKPDKDKKNEDGEGDTVTKEPEFLRKKVTNLMKKQKLHQVRQIVKGQDDSKPWGQDA